MAFYDNGKKIKKYRDIKCSSLRMWRATQLCACAVTNRLALQEKEFTENNPLKRGVFSISVGNLLNLI